MKNKLLFYFGILFFLTSSLYSNAQDQITCGFDLLHEKHMKENEAAREAMLKFEGIWQNALNEVDVNKLQSALQSGDSIYEIPLVFHIIHPDKHVGTSYNPSNQDIESVVDYLNDVFAATWSNYPDVNNGGTKINIKFVLAKRDPECNPTTGINRINTATALSPTLAAAYEANGVKLSTSNGISDGHIKNLSRWDNENYYNIWVVNKIDGWSGYTSGGGVVGYAYFPGASANIDGTVIMEAFNKPGQMTLPHELAHGLAIYHTFQGGCADPQDCGSTGDYICDTDPHSQVNGCPTGINPCTGDSWQPVVHNIMNYGTCQNRFTVQQGERMILALQSLRPGLLNSLGGIAPGEEDSSPTPDAAVCTPETNTNSFAVGNSSLKIESYLNYISPQYPKPESTYYRDYTESSCSSVPYEPITLTRGESYNIISEHYYNDQNTKIWIDYNNDGELTEDEVFFSTLELTSSNSQNTTLVKYYDANSLAVPSHAVVNTPIRMRVINEYKDGNEFYACDNLPRGRALDFTVIINPALSISDYNEIGKLNISPNPFDNYLDIESEKAFKGALKIINVLGQEVYAQEGLQIQGGGKLQIRLDELPLATSLYHLMLINEDGQVVHKKIMKK